MKTYQYLSFLLIIFLLVFNSCKKDEELNWEEGTCLVEVDGEFIDIELDIMPEYLNGGEEGFSLDLLQELRYPAEARENGIEGICIIEFEISKSGVVHNISIVSDPGGGIGEAAVEALSTICEGIAFSPGILDGQPVRVKKEINIRFKLEG